MNSARNRFWQATSTFQNLILSTDKDVSVEDYEHIEGVTLLWLKGLKRLAQSNTEASLQGMCGDGI